MDLSTSELRKKYINNPPEGMTPEDIRSMSDEELLDMDYFMNEELDDDFGEDGFYPFKTPPQYRLFLHTSDSIANIY